MTTFLIFALAVPLLLLLTKRIWFSFTAQTSADYAGTEPRFDIRKHLSGPLVSEGMIYGPRGRVESRFVARMTGDWTGDTGTLSEEFTYASGATQSRRWHLSIGNGQDFTATADDIIGIARGRVAGASLHMTYRLRLPEASGGHVLDVKDWLYLMENGTIMNKSEMRKYGLKVAELIATMRPAT